MRKLSIDELKKVNLEVLDAVVKFCDENNIGYILNFGTLLGAVRHKGYIPWDDDIDISMLRPDYDKFMATFNDYNPRYVCYCGDYTKNLFILHGCALDTRGEHIGIDIFCLDNVPDDDKVLKKLMRRYFFYKALFGAKQSSIFRSFKGYPRHQRILGRLLCIIMHLLPVTKSYLLKKAIGVFKKYRYENTKRVGTLQNVYRVVIDREKVANTVYAEFEGRQYKIPAGYDELLSKLYGDYMQLPPKDMQVPKHEGNAYFKDGCE